MFLRCRGRQDEEEDGALRLQDRLLAESAVNICSKKEADAFVYACHRGGRLHRGTIAPQMLTLFSAVPQYYTCHRYIYSYVVFAMHTSKSSFRGFCGVATGIRCDKGEVEEERKADGTDVRCLLNVKT